MKAGHSAPGFFPFKIYVIFTLCIWMLGVGHVHMSVVPKEAIVSLPSEH